MKSSGGEARMTPVSPPNRNVIRKPMANSIGASTFIFLYNVYKTWRTGERVTADDPWGFANSLEWATSCPPPRHNFTSIPRIRSERPAFDLHYPHIRTGRDRGAELAGQSSIGAGS
jgi:cytochrome c oxidase subunit I